jgi:hypothetical protein
MTEFRKVAVEALTPLSRGPRFVVERDVIFFMGLKLRGTFGRLRRSRSSVRFERGMAMAV